MYISAGKLRSIFITHNFALNDIFFDEIALQSSPLQTTPTSCISYILLVKLVVLVKFVGLIGNPKYLAASRRLKVFTLLFLLWLTC